MRFQLQADELPENIAEAVGALANKGLLRVQYTRPEEQKLHTGIPR